MHTPETQPRASIYYNYKIHTPWLASQHGPQTRKPVVIVGSGPAGMVSALELARYGVASVIVTSELQVSQGSRAIVFTRRSMEILQQVGVAKRMVENGLPWRFGRSFYRGQCVFRMEAPHDADDRFGPMLNIQQQYMEEYLLQACQATGLIEVRWGNKCVGVTQHSDHVQLDIDTPEGVYELQSDWLVAADGGRSGIRSDMNLKMEGASYEGFFVIADIKINLPYPTERRAYFDPDWNRGNTILMHREPHGIWRVDYQLPEGESPEAALKPESLSARINAQLAMIGHAGEPWELDWSSVYSARTLTLPRYVHDRVIFTGDAAHLLPIFGVRGANTAFQDAQSLGWHLAFVIQGWAPVDFLNNHSQERVGAAREIIDEAGKSTRFMAPPKGGFELLRNAVLSLSLTQDFVRPLYHWRTSRPHAYVHSALNCVADDNALFEQGPSHGAPPQNVRLSNDDFLLDHLGGAFDLLCFTQATAIADDVLEAVEQFAAQGVPIRITAIGSQRSVAGAHQVLNDATDNIYKRYGVTTQGAAYLLRPDQHVCARWLRLDGARLTQALTTALMRQTDNA